MTDNVVKPFTEKSGECPDAILEQAVGQYEQVLIIGWDKAGQLEARCTKGLVDSGELLRLLEKFKLNLLAGEYEE